MTTDSKKQILVIGATGAQGLAVVDSILAPSADGTPSPYTVRALTRDPNSQRARGLAEKGVELFKGSFDDLNAVRKAFEGVYGAFVNTDGFTVGEEKEIYVGMKIFEIAKQTKSVKHYVWSNLDNYLKKGNYDEKYNCEHTSGKGRVGEWLTTQPSDTSKDGMTWSCVCTGPYMDMLHFDIFGPQNKREDGTYVFATPLGKGHVPMIAVKDVGFWARYSFDHREEVSARDLEVASEMVTWDYLASTFTAVTGKKAVVVYQSIDDWMKNYHNVDEPVARNFKKGDGTITFRKNFSAWWATYRDDNIKRDMDWIRSVHPDSYTLERWMRENGYDGDSQKFSYR
ncbi:NAD(P)-binding protein [Irpex rosettiformis]|uniref:NAD(P)-binding protein n=1 Tax=Irpex rosettiformis TaxID=378272 RepID=A0ACB8TPI4_9APHY|nr:NAD(P)-binding protein [Irpex rosettiformis]